MRSLYKTDKKAWSSRTRRPRRLYVYFKSDAPHLIELLRMKDIFERNILS